MSLISAPFFIFFAIVVLVYYLLPGKLQWIWLFLSSMVFYYQSSTWQQMVLFLFYILINWLAAMLMDRCESRKKTIYISALAADLLMLSLFKYCAFFCQIITGLIRLFSASFDGSAFDRLIGFADQYAPIRISYFALIIIGYLTDVFWGKNEAQKNPCKVILFAGFFPQMTSGPITQYDDMQSRLWGEKHRFQYENVVRGVERALWGIFKKLVISERCAVVVNTIYAYYEAYAGFYIIVAAFMFALQLYADFSGLMDIVLGFSQCLGIELPENFNTPFYSTGLQEFWRRWHITLGGFLRDYILYPLERTERWRKMRKWCKAHLGKNYEHRCNLPFYASLVIAWFLIGLWHGGGWNYIFGVGLYMCIVIVIGDLLSPFFKKLTDILHINTAGFSWKMFQRFRTACLFVFGLSFFRAESLADGFKMWKSAFSLCNPWIFFDGSLYGLGLTKDEWLIMLLGLLMFLVVSILQQRDSVREMLHRQNYLFRLLVFLVLFVMIINWGYYGTDFVAADFIYGRF
ncbi:MAG: MBOAT family protein [Lachnospiraceae bacterium]|nr:MBOAT family protein [Lachnospiraceae bacterium]